MGAAAPWVKLGQLGGGSDVQELAAVSDYAASMLGRPRGGDDLARAVGQAAALYLKASTLSKVK